ncbi:MAG: Eco57I restriction-modification methylase domain-containing protein [Prevotellaceae bacterium]|nr:Eco57I restriction-modification methylase domain-containing protein [Prevotellaceae bacterium]
MEYFSDLKAKLIYVFRINDAAHRDCVKIGEATFEDGDINLPPNSVVLNRTARRRIDQYTKTAGIAYELLHTEVAIFSKGGRLCGINDHKVHEVLDRSGVKKKKFPHVDGANEWYVCDLETAKQAIAAAKAGRAALNAGQVGTRRSPIVFRAEQREAIGSTLKHFRRSNKMLWNAKMRFGKTLSALQVVKEWNQTVADGKKHQPMQRVLILTHRPVVDEGWFEDFGKIFYDDATFMYGSKSKSESFQSLESRSRKGEGGYVYFASMQDLRGSELVGGHFDKNDELFSAEWDLIIVDEAHEGTQTELGKSVLNELVKETTKVLNLSGTPFNLLNDYSEDEIYTWDYVMEQRAKAQWDIDHPGDHNPYAALPTMHIYTYDLGRLLNEFADEELAFNFKEFFRVDDSGEFVHKRYIQSFLNLLTKTDEHSMYPFANERYRNIFRHTLWIVPGVKEAAALEQMLLDHDCFGARGVKIVNVAGDMGVKEDDDTRRYNNALEKVQQAITADPSATETITLSCGRLTTGVSVPAWTGVLMLSGNYNTAAASYMQTIFRVQTPATICGRVKEDCYVFDFAPDRTLRVLAETAKVSRKAGKQTDDDRRLLREFLNFCPVIGIEGSRMKQYDTEQMLQQLKRVYVERVVRNGFEDGYLYNDELMKLSALELKEFNNLKGIIGKTKAIAKSNKIAVNEQGLTNEEYAEMERLNKKKKSELSDEERARREELAKRRKLRDDAISILRGISIRMPLLIYGANIVDEDRELTIDNFTALVDDTSWEEFMPRGVSKEHFNDFKKYYDPDIFTAAAKRIRQMARAADNLTVEERIGRIADIFSTFRNPDKETVLTPWRVVNMHMSDCLGGYTFFNEDFSDTIEEPRFVERDNVTADVFRPDACLLEINSKSGLYPLYLAYNVYRSRLRDNVSSPRTLAEHQAIWDAVIADNIFVICKTPMAKTITRRTLFGFRKGKTNMWAPDDLINKIKNQPELFIKKVSNLVGKDMRIKAIVGNPPYQEMDGGAQASAIPVYNLFVDMAKRLIPNYMSMIMPARWYAGGKGLDAFREDMLNDDRIKTLFDYTDSRDIFPTVNIAGGICYFLHEHDYHGECRFENITAGERKVSYRKLNEHSVFVRSTAAIDLLQKVSSKEEETLSSIVFSRKPFGFPTNYVGYENSNSSSVALYGRQGVSYVDRADVVVNSNVVDEWKVICSRASESAGRADKDGKRKVLPKVKVLEPNVICSETYLLVYHSADKIIVDNAAKYLCTKFLRYLLSLKVITQQISRDSFAFVPIQDFTAKSDIDWSKSVAEIDKQLYRKYNLTEEEINFIESMIKPMS